MKNILKKTAGVMLVASMLCAMLATGCTASENSTAPENNKVTESKFYGDIELTQQTLVDEVTGVQATGMLPVGANLIAVVEFTSQADIADRFDSYYTLEEDYPKYEGRIGDYETYQADREISDVARLVNEKNWASWEGTLGGVLSTEIYFVKDSEIIEFESDFTISMPFDYRKALVRGGIDKDDEATVLHYDYDKNEFVNVELVPAEDTPKAMFQFKEKSSGLFFMGAESRLNNYLDYYEGKYESGYNNLE